MTQFNDRIVYVAKVDGNITRADFDETNLKTNISLDSHYDPKSPTPELDKIVVKPSEVLMQIKKKLNPIELLVLKSFGGKL